MLEAHEIDDGIWQGSYPSPGTFVADHGFGMLVLCARELQTPSVYYPKVKVVHAPNDDDPDAYPLTRQSLQTALQAAAAVVEHVERGEKALVTCRAGVNRSGLVVALAIHKRRGYSGTSCIDMVRLNRKPPSGATPLFNHEFVEALSRLPGRDVIVLPGLPPIDPK